LAILSLSSGETEHHGSGSIGGGGTHLLTDRKQRKGKGLRAKYNFQRDTPSDLLHLPKLQLLKFPPFPKIAPLLGNQKFNTEPVGDILYSNHNLPIAPKGSWTSHNTKGAFSPPP
jgi:hypothetical protein